MIGRVKITLRGIVQGVGFRPFIFRMAEELELKGTVYNSADGVFIEAEGSKNSIDELILRIENEKPAQSVITGMEFSYLDPIGCKEFNIIESRSDENCTVLISPDIAVCSECIDEMNDPADRRYGYPFINCTNCGPRYSIIESLPYDRPNTSMKHFEMCGECRNEYSDPYNRRFHAQPIACNNCGPQVFLTDSQGDLVVKGNQAVWEASQKIREGKIIALKGLGGFQLLADAADDNAVFNLRKRKNRDEKPFALMFPDIDQIIAACLVNDYEKRLLKSPEAPIVLLEKRPGCDSKYYGLIAPENPYLGVMLPYTPLHYLLMQILNVPIIATSGNISDEPMCTGNNEAYHKLGSTADYFLTHDREINRAVDDSIVRIVNNKELVIRRARGYAPLPVQLPSEDKSISLAVGAHLKNTVSLKIGKDIFISQHIGDLSCESANSAFLKAVDDFKLLYGISNSDIICDKHPDYFSTLHAKNLTSKPIDVQHHFAHIASCRAENQLSGKTLGVSWDGTGCGLGGELWGGEFFISDDEIFTHTASFRTFRLPGGEAGIRESRRASIGVLYEIFGDDMLNCGIDFDGFKFSENELKILLSMLKQKINSPITSSAGRLFDAVSSLLGVSHVSNYEGQSAMKLEFIADRAEKSFYEFSLIRNKKFIVDWELIIISIIEDKKKGLANSKISAKFHNTLAVIILKVALILNEKRIVLSGGCFQNIYLLKRTIEILEKNDFSVYVHQRIPPNDGGISLGQIAARNMRCSDFYLIDQMHHSDMHKNNWRG